MTNRGHVIVEPEKGQIKTAIEAFRQGTAGPPLNAGLLHAHPINKYYNQGVPVIEAAKYYYDLNGHGWGSPGGTLLVNGKRFTINLYYNEYQYYNEVVHANVPRNYATFSPAEFFAEVYTAFYEDYGKVPPIPDAQLGARVAVGSWSDWIRANVHSRGLAPAAPAAGGAHPAAPDGGAAGSPEQHAALPGAGVGKAAHRSGGASSGS
jgi:hypothetical protein